MKQVMKISGKANQVFKYVDLLKRHKGNVNIKELSKGNKTIRLNFNK